jgi:hypothetical protein
MAKSKVSFSLDLLKSNLKWHKEMLGRYNKTAKRKTIIVQFQKTIDKRLEKQKQFVKDLETAIKTLKKIK